MAAMGVTMKILLADDDPDILDITAYALRRDGFIVSLASDGAQALSKLEAERPDVMLLDVRMPRINGFEVLRTIRMQSEAPVIMVTARGDEEDIIRGLELGADDYVTKPFSLRQLASRIRTVARRTRKSLPQPATELEVAGMVLDIESHEVRRGNLRVRLTPIEFRLVYPLALNPGRVVSSNRLVEQAWGFDGGDAHMIKTHFSHVRKKLRLQRGEPGYIECIPSVGYILHR